MSAFLPFELADPVDGKTWNFVPFARKDGVFTYVATHESPMPELRPSVTISTTMPSKTSKLMKVRAKLSFPCGKQLVADGPDVYSHTVSADVTFLLPQISNVDQRSILLGMMKALLASSAPSTAITAAEPIY